MTLKSMTGFARGEGGTQALAWTWEVRSVNGRGLDVRLRLPPGFEGLEPKVREAVARAVVRGNVSVNLTVKRTEGAGEIRLNPQAVAVVADAVEALRRALPGAAQVNIDGLLALKGVLEFAEPDADEAAAETRTPAMLATLDAALAGLDAARLGEGRRLASVLGEHLSEIERLVGAIATSPARTPAAIGARLKDQLDRLLAQSGQALDPARLHQEAALLATKTDIEEEISRLGAHVAAARDLLHAQEPIGRKFDFLTQEFNREANTVCSKSNDIEMTRNGLALKAVIDQMREQVQNIE
jgi:uncharacterized protein (TIGR00255 family)